MRDTDGTRTLASGIALGLVGYLLVLPLLLLLAAAFRGPADLLPFESGARWTLENFTDFYSDRSLYTTVLPDTVRFCLGSCAIAYPLGLLFAWLTERSRVPMRPLMVSLIAVPLMLPTPLMAIAWMQMLGPHAGWINVALRALLHSSAELGPFNLFSMPGLVFCQGMTAAPVAFFLLRPAIRAIDADGERAAYASGSTPFPTFWRISLPQILPSLLAPLLLLLLLTFEQVDFPYIIGPAAQITVLGTRLLWELNQPSGLPDIGGTAAAALLFLAIAMVGLTGYNRLTRQSHRFRTRGSGAPQEQSLDSRRHWGWGTAVIWVYVLLAAVLPVAELVLTSLNASALSPSDLHVSWSIAAYQDMLRQGELWIAAGHTVLVAVLAGLISTAAGVLLAMLIDRRRTPLARLLDLLSITSIGIPAVVIAAATAMTYLTVKVGVYGTVWILVIAYSYRVALTTRAAGASLSQLDPSLAEAASLCGASWLRTQWRVVMPQVLPAAIASFALMMLLGVREFAIPLMLSSPKSTVLSVMLLQLFQSGRTAEAAVVAVLLIIVSVVLLTAIRVAGGLARSGAAS